MSRKTELLVTRFSAMGDVAMTSPVVSEVCRRYPNAHITYVTNPFFLAFFPSLDNFSFFGTDFKGRHKGTKGLIKLFKELREVRRYDVVIDLHDVLRSKVLRGLFALMGTKVVCINKGRTQKRALTRQDNKQLAPLTSTVERYAEAFARAGFPVSLPSVQPHVQRATPPAIHALTGEKQGRWIGIAPFAQHKGKIYPLQQMEQVISLLNERGDCTLFVFGGGVAEREVAERFESKYEHCISVIGKIKLHDELDLIANLNCMVSMDSSAMHMASLMGVRVVSVWGATHPFAGFMGYGQSAHDAVQVDLACRPCSIYGNKPCFKGSYECMTSINPSSIANKAVED